MRWVLLVLYLLLLIGFAVGEVTAQKGIQTPILCIVTVASLAIFILGSGHKNLCRPIRRPRLVLPVVVAAFMLCALIAGLTVAFSELVKVSGPDDSDIWFWVFLTFNWLLWGALLYIYTRNIERHRAIHRLAKVLFAGSLAELLAAVPSHIFVERRGGCFAGISTGVGVLAGVYVMFWSFGPGIMLLFLAEAHRRQEKIVHRGLDARLEKRGPLQFHLRTMLLLTLALGVNFGLIKVLWGDWRACALAAILVILLLTLFLVRQSKLLTSASLLVIVGLFFVTWGDRTAVISLGFISTIMLCLAWRTYARPTSFASSEQSPK